MPQCPQCGGENGPETRACALCHYVFPAARADTKAKEWAIIGRDFLRRRQANQALECARKALQLDPDCHEARELLEAAKLKLEQK